MDKKEDHIYIAIDLKSFYASVECQERNLNPLTTNLVVADRERTEKNHLSGSFSFFEGIWDTGKGKAF